MSNKDRVTVRITSRTAESGEIRQEVDADRYIKETAVYLRYAEPSPEMGATMTTVKIARHEIRIIRHGDVESEHTFVAGARRSGFYNTPHGRLQLETETGDLQVELSGGTGRVHWQYELTVSGEAAGRFSLTIDIG